MARTRASAPASAPAAQPARVGGHAAGGGTPEASARHWSARFLLLAAIWGCSFLFIKIGDEAFAPLQVALGRLIFGAGALLVALAARGDRLPRPGRVWGRLAVAALLLNTLPFSLFAYGETRVTSVLAGIWNATTPLLTLAVALLTLPEERPSRERVVGLAVGFAGVLVVLGAWQGFGGRAVLGNLACFGAACCYGLGLPYMRKHLAGRPESALALSAAQLLCGAAELAIVTPVLATAPITLPPARAFASVVALGVLGTGLAYVLNYGLIRDAGATVASTVTYAIPLFSTLAGVLVLGEPLTWNQPAGALVVILGVVVSQGRWRAIARRLGAARAGVA